MGVSGEVPRKGEVKGKGVIEGARDKGRCQREGNLRERRGLREV